MLFQQVRPRVLVSGMGVSRARVDPDRVTKRVLEPASAPRQRGEQRGEQGESADAERLAELTEREAVTRGLIAGSPFAMIAMDADGRLMEFNAAAEELSGYRRDDVLGKQVPELLVPERERAEFLKHVETLLNAGGQGEFTGRMRVPLLRADGTERVAELIPVQVTVKGKTTFWGILRDLGEGERLNEQRAQFLAIVSHELRTPLTSIVSFSELMRSEAEGLTPEGRHFLDIIERNADRLLRLVGDLLMLDRLEAGALPLDLDLVSIPGLVTEAVANASPGAAKQGITVLLDVGSGPPVQGDSRRLLQVFDNLIGNAVKFSHVGGQVRVVAACDGTAWRIDVTDAGIGIPPEDVARLFGPFVRGTNARMAGLPGTGLGLSIVKVLVEMHGGHVDVDSVLDEGSTFSVSIPVPT
jgi:PAS domain S-box-containing protein